MSSGHTAGRSGAPGGPHSRKNNNNPVWKWNRIVMRYSLSRECETISDLTPGVHEGYICQTSSPITVCLLPPPSPPPLYTLQHYGPPCPQQVIIMHTTSSIYPHSIVHHPSLGIFIIIQLQNIFPFYFHTQMTEKSLCRLNYLYVTHTTNSRNTHTWWINALKLFGPHAWFSIFNIERGDKRKGFGDGT
jgi:hypothetical protein